MRNHYVRWLGLLAFLCFFQMALAQNDLCSGAIAITPGTITGSTIGSTFDNVGFCGTSNTAPGVWYTFTGTGGEAVLTTCGAGTDFDTKLTAFSGSCGGLVCEAGDDDEFSCVFSSAHSQVSFTTTNGASYFVLVHGFGSNAGDFDLTFELINPPANDDCAGAESINIAASGSVNGDLRGANDDIAPDCGTTNGSGAGVWYTFTGTGDFIELETCGGASFDTKILAYSGSCAGLTCVTGNDDDCGLQSSIGFITTAGTNYYILVDAFSSTTSAGLFTLNYTILSTTPPVNDECTTAFDILSGETKTGNTRFATAETNASVGGCGGVTYDGSNGVWYRYVGDGDPITFETCGSSYDTKLNVYAPFFGCAVSQCLAAGDDECGGNARVSISTTAGSEYFILVHGDGASARGDYELTAIPGANNDECIDAIAVTCGDVVSGNTASSNTDGLAFSCNSIGYDGFSGGVWYKITGAGGPITASLCGSDFDTKIHVYSGNCALGGLNCITGNDDVCGLQSEATWLGDNGTEYLILVSGFDDERGDFEIEISCSIPLPNDFCTTAFPIAANTPTVGNTVNAIAELESGLSCGAFYSGGKGLWYTYTPATGAPTVFSTCNAGTDFDTKIGIFSGSCGALVCEAGDDDEPGCNFASVASLCTQAGETYYILVYGFGSADDGTFELLVEPQVAPANDECANAEAVAIGSTTPGSTTGACPDDNGTVGTSSNGTGAVWYSFTGAGDWMDVNTCGPGFDTKIQVFSGSCGAFTNIGGNDDAGFANCSVSSVRSRLVFFAQEGITYYVKVFGFSIEGDFELTVDLAPEVNPLMAYDPSRFVMVLNGVPGPNEFVSVDPNNLTGPSSLLLVRYPSGAGEVTGTLAPRGTSLARWDVNIQLRDRKNWADWNAGGGLYKGSSAIAAANHQNWTFSEIAPGSYLSGHPGSGYAGDTLWLAHMPANMTYGMQRGLGANDFNNNFGMSGWFTFSGSYAGSGDLNASIDPRNVVACENSPINCSPNPVSPIVIALEGANGDNGMRTTLSSNGLLPQTQPFNNATYSYSGTESFVGTMTNAVDWVLVSLRDPANPRTIVARRAAIVSQDGTLLNTDGTVLNLRDLGTANQEYYVAISHNNHLDVMTKDPQSLTSGVDFTKGAEMFYQDLSKSNEPFAKLPNGKVAMASGDINGDGVIDDMDIAEIQNHFHEAGIKNQDLDHDGLVTPQDLRSMMHNRGASSHVPK
ncbi:MAG: dockerin type I repeat-containing protein [Bacteroidia bacterium]